MPSPSRRASESIETKVITEKLPCKLTREESHCYAKQIAQLVSEAALVEARKKTANSAFKEQLDDINKKAGELSTKVNDDQEYRKVDRRKEMHFAEAIVRVVRLDTHEEIENRKMTVEEMQRTIDWGGDNGDDDEGSTF